jgi:hypothetical protein
MNTLARWILPGVFVFSPLVAQAAFINFTATLTVEDEFPVPNVGTATPTGSLTAVLDTDTNQFNWILTATGLTANTTAVHFHGNTPFPPNHTGLARPVVLGFIGGGDPDVVELMDSLEGNTSGTYIGTADLDLALSDRAGDFPLTIAQQIEGLLNTQWYVNVHNGNNPAGEIRGQVFLAGPIAVPVPAVAWIVGLAFGAVPLWAGRRRTA